MSVLIKGMEMPTNCFLCPLSVLNENRLFCEVTKNEVLRAKIYAECPLVPVPPHGRLGDLDELERRIKEEGANQAEQYGDRRHPVVMAYGDCFGKVKSAPTIIPAEEEE